MSAMAECVFPPGFLWGTSLGAHQSEGNNLASDWWAIETAPDSPLPEPSGDAIDGYHRWNEDLELAADAGMHDFRFGIEWSRIEPADGHWSLANVQHYRRIIDRANELGLRPLPTLHHFTLPLWFSRSGGWRRPDAVERFLRYVDAVAPVLDGGVERIETINEPNIVAVLAVGASDLSAGLPVPDPEVTAVMLELHDAVRVRLKSNHPAVLTGWGVSVQDYQPDPDAAPLFDAYVHPRDEVFLAASRGDDWVGVQAYTRGRLKNVDGHAQPYLDPKAPLTQTGWENYPNALGGAVRRTARVVGDVPIIVTENGIATADDDERIRFTTQALTSLRAAMDDGIDVRGYLHWSLLDNYEWGTWEPTFGLIAVDRATFNRRPKPSLAWLGSLAPPTDQL
ncbi:family 1 glycosylhydrolase [Mycolicibacterium sp. 018/SC-01/001]|uniref:family 1 glycosylhydrolase n=1 Tax=Mycolicibacterium sp. 018/SC-01/001 TaxID=2592069 RepID=UPI002107AE23|nr:family 1 glycosylhydrolase [Mycolicibacterium sp. 018/SC-01/001]